MRPELDDSMSIEIRSQRARLRSPIDPTIVVAIVASPAIAALVTGILRLIEKKIAQPSRVVIRGRDGRSLEFDSTVDDKKLKQLVETLEQIEAPRIEIVRR